MSFEIITTEFFQKQARRLLKKYPSLRTELQSLKTNLLQDPAKGTPIGMSCYKIRLAIASKNTGKSGGARVITYVYVEGEVIFLLSVYDKSEQQNISPKQLKILLSTLDKEL